MTSVVASSNVSNLGASATASHRSKGRDLALGSDALSGPRRRALLPPTSGPPSAASLQQEQAVTDRLVNGTATDQVTAPDDASMASPHHHHHQPSLFDAPPSDGSPNPAAGPDNDHNHHGSSPNGSDMASNASSKDLAASAHGGGAGRGGKKKGDKPAWSELKTKAGKERKRLPLACIACRRKKIRCSGEKPACKHCLRSRTPCVYKVTTRKAAPRTDYMTMLDKRLKRMEERVIKIIPAPDPAKMASIGRASVKPPAVQAPKAAGAKKRAAEEAFGNEVEQWSNPGGKPDSDQHLALHDRAGSSLQTDGAEFLPPKEIQEHLAEVFFDCCYGQAYHLLHKPSFQRRLRNGAVPPVLILSVCAMSARFSTHPQINSEPAFLRGEQWAKPAREIALRHYDEPNITILITLMIMGLHEFGTCQGGRSWMLAGMAMRMAHSLQLHRELDGDPLGLKKDKATESSFTDREIRRRAMWACFMMDRFISSGTERPMMLNERDIEIQLPVSEFMYYHETPGITETLDGRVVDAPDGEDGEAAAKDNMGVAAHIIRVIALWGRVVRYFNLGGKKKDPHAMWADESKFYELKRLAERFPDSLPPRLRYTAENLRVHKTEKIANQFLTLHIAHQEILLFMHRFAIPMSPGGAPPADMPADFVQMAARAAVEAAGKVSQLLAEGPTHSLMAPFIGYCAFLSSTVHVWCIFSKNPALEGASKRHLATNVRHLKHLKKYWGLMYHMSDTLRTIYRQFADAATRKGGDAVREGAEPDAAVLEYGGWLSAFPHGVSHTDYQEPAPSERNTAASDAALSQRSDLKTVEEFFDTLQPPAIPQRRKGRRQSQPSKQQQPKHQAQKPQQPTQQPQQPQQPTPPQPQRRRTHDSGVQPRALGSTVKQEQTWSPPTQFSPQAAAGFSSAALFPLPQQQQQAQAAQQRFRRPSGPPATSAGPRHPSQTAPHRAQRASFDASFAQHQQQRQHHQQQPRLHTAGLDAFSPAALYSPHGFVGAQAAAAAAAAGGGFAGGGGGGGGGFFGDDYGLGMSVGDMDRQRVFGAHATDPGVAMDMWDFGGLAAAAGTDPAATQAQAQAAAMAEAADPDDMAGLAGDAFALAGDAGSAWFTPFNMHVDHFAAAEFAAADFGPAGGATPSLHADGSEESVAGS